MRNILTYLLLFVSVAVHAVIAKPGSGVYGDEYYHYRKNSDGSITAMSPQLDRQGKRAPQIATQCPTKGKVRGLVILVEFNDLKFVTPNANKAFENMLNQKGYSANGGTGSAKDYFLANSYGLFQPDFDVYGPVTLSKNMSYYDDKVVKMIVEACDSLEHEIDWDAYDNNDDGYVDNLFIYYAGYNEAEYGPEESIWPHRSYVYDGQYYYYYLGKSGKKRILWDYACTSELRGYSGKRMCGIGTFCHEFSHILGLADLYDTSNGENYTVGEWDIMGSGNYNNDGNTPPSYSAFERFMVGWLTPIQLNSTGNYLLEPIESGAHAYLIANGKHNLKADSPNPKEYWLLENRQRTGWDEPAGALVGAGMLITHITFDSKKWDNNTPNNSKPFVYDICEAGTRKPSGSLPSDIFPGSGHITYFVPTANSGEEYADQQIKNIRPTTTGNMAFHFGDEDGLGLTISPNEPEIIMTEVEAQQKHYKVAVFTVEGKGLTDTELYFKTTNRTFAISVDSVKWSTQNVFVPVQSDSTYHGKLYVRYEPAKMCSEQEGTLVVSQKNEAAQTIIPISGKSVRATLIQPVEVLEGSDVTPYSFKATWKEQSDAEVYYLTLYSLKDEQETHTERIVRQLKADGETYVSELNILPINQLVIKISQHYKTSSSKGYVIVEGQQNGEWMRVDSVLTRATNTTITLTYKFTNEQNCHRWRVRNQLVSGEGYVTVEESSITTNQKPEYVYQGMECFVFAPADEIPLLGLRPQTDYYYYLVCQEEKGCSPHTTEPGNTMHVHTLAGTTKTNKQFTIANINGEVTAYLPNAAAFGSKLIVYTSAGNLVEEIELTAGEVTFRIPSQGLIPQQLYLVKYMSGSGITRKGIWSKFIY